MHDLSPIAVYEPKDDWEVTFYWSPWNNIEDAWMLVTYLRSKGWHFGIFSNAEYARAYFFHPDDYGPYVYAHILVEQNPVNYECEAICRAALNTVGMR